MPRPRFERLDPETRNRLLEAAAREFAAHGFETASLNRLIEEAGISKGSFYYYFDDKADLFATVVKMAWEVCVPRQRLDFEVLEAGTFWPTLRAYLEEFSATAREKTWLAGIARLIYRPPREARVSELVAQEFERVHAFMGRLMHRGQELGVVRTDLPEPLLLQLLLAVGETADRWIVERWEELEPDEIESITARIFEALRTLAAPWGEESASG